MRAVVWTSEIGRLSPRLDVSVHLCAYVSRLCKKTGRSHVRIPGIDSTALEYLTQESRVFSLVSAGAIVLQRRRLHQRRFMQLSSLADYYEKGIARLDRKWGLLDGGEGFIDQDHFYSKDLDLFGRGSLYQLLCSARTQMGRDTVANWMVVPASIEEIQVRNAAVTELRERRDLPESLATSGPMVVSDCRPEFLKTWAAEPPSLFPSWARPLAFLLMLVAIALPVLFWSGLLGLHNLWVCLVALFSIQAIFAGTFRHQVKSLLESLGPLSIELPIVCELLQIVERGQFTSVKLRTLASSLACNGSAASTNIRRLQQLIRLVKERENEWFAYLSYCLLWATQFAMAIEHWRRRHGSQMLEWVAALGEFEALISLSTYSYEHPGDTFPQLVEKGPQFEAEGLGHPLLEENTCVRNDIQLSDAVRFLIVSGSNMSGKSTFLRAIGLNVSLALMGAPVRCAKLRLSPLAIGAAIRIQDSVVDGLSHFLAEMQRLRRMIEAADQKTLLFLADEIMSGTNSHDRRIATEWVLRALMLRGAIGAITTHDLALTEIATNGLPGRNVYFEDSGEFGNLSFDYKLRNGVLSRSNALNIAHLLGIDTAAIKSD
jgi:DNA mismatch repair ATPase MutS